MVEVLRRELFYFWLYFSLMLYQIGGYWLFGMVLGSLISVFGKQKLHSMFVAMRNKNMGLLGIIPAALIGIASPLCMYGTIPISASFAEKGMGEDWLAAFMMCSILLNPQLLLYTAALGKVALTVRLISGFLCGIVAGLVIHFFCKGKKFFNFKGFGEVANRDTDPNLLVRFLKNLWRNIKATGPAFLIGVSLAALFQRYVPAETVSYFFGKYRAGALIMAASIGVPLYACGGATIPMLMEWMRRGMTLGAATTFMIAGPAMKITNLGAVKVILGIKHFLLYLLFSTVFSIAAGFIIDSVLKIL